VVFPKVTSTKLVLQKSNSSGNLAAQNVAFIRFRRVHYGTANMWLVRRKLFNEKSPAYVERVGTRRVANLRISPAVMGKVAHSVRDKIALANTSELSIPQAIRSLAMVKNSNTTYCT
jgi:hypothetical protein